MSHIWIVILAVHNKLFIAIAAEFDRLMIDERLSGAVHLPKFIEDYLFSNTQ